MTVPLRSLRARLLLWLLVPLVLISVALLGEAYLEARRQANVVFDRTLAGSALAIAERVALNDSGEVEVDLPYVALEMLTSAADDRVFYAVREADGNEITGYTGLPGPDELPAVGDDPVFFDGIYRGDAIRGVALAGASSNAYRSIGYAIIVAETTQGRAGLAQSMLVRSALRLSALITLAALIVWLGVQRGLRPLDTLQAAVGRRSSDDLRPITHAAPTEAAALLDAINAFIDRLRGSLASLRHFTGNAGHQLRTPLTIIRTNIALARRTDDRREMARRLEAAETAAGDAERLIHQFLLLSQIRNADAPTQQFDLAQLAEDAARDRAPIAHERDLELGFQGCGGELPVQGDPVLVRELIFNLIDNAIHHAAPAQATVRVGNTGGTVFVEVRDTGPGVPAGALPDLTNRHVGGPTDTKSDGFGLGLAISKEIAERFGGALALATGDDGAGLTVTARFPVPA